MAARERRIADRFHQAPSARRRLREESGQALALTVVTMLVLLGFCGTVLDVGKAYYTQHALQSSVDAAALAGAAQLPDSTSATNMATQYGGTSTGRNAHPNISGVSESISVRCATSMSGCTPTNVISVSDTTQVGTAFLSLFGVKKISVTARATACGHCGGRPADIVLIFDRTLSMCMTFSGANDPSCTKLNNARAGMETLLAALDPAYDRVSLVVLPPASTTNSGCTAPPSNIYNSTTAAWLLVPLTSSYQTSSGALDHKSKLVSTIDCLPAAGSTAYATAIDQAQAELNKDGRAGVEHDIVFFTDGAANTGPSYYPANSPYRTQPCHQGVTSANQAKAQGTIVYAIGYTLSGMGGSANQCLAGSISAGPEQPPITAYDALTEIASNSNTFYNQPAASSLTDIFTSVASQVTGPSLIPDNTP